MVGGQLGSNKEFPRTWGASNSTQRPRLLQPLTHEDTRSIRQRTEGDRVTQIIQRRNTVFPFRPSLSGKDVNGTRLQGVRNSNPVRTFCFPEAHCGWRE